MSKKRKKSIEDNTRMIMINHEEFVGKNQVIAYLLEKMKSYAGYFFISIGPVGSVFKKNPEKKNIVRVTVHQTIPCMQPDGLYKSAKDIVIDAIAVDDENFPGLVIDKLGNGILGNPFAPIQEKNIPNLGDKDAGTYTPSESEEHGTLSPTEPPKPTFGEDEKVEQI